MVKTMTFAAGLLVAVLAANGCKSNEPVEVVQSPAYEPRPLSEPVTVDMPVTRTYEPAVIDPAPAAWPGPDGSAAPVAPAPAAAAPQRIHVVQRNDTLWSIAARYYGDGKKLRQIADANGIADPNKLQVGQKLIIP